VWYTLGCVYVGRLQHRKAKEWGDNVRLVFGDMRTIEVPEKADILISELLGSFGDNELSPECLDGAMRFLKRKFPPNFSILRYESRFMVFRRFGWPMTKNVLLTTTFSFPNFSTNILRPCPLPACQHWLLALIAEGISIPSSYTAHLAPLSSSKLYNEARSSKNEKSLETPYVVMFQNVNILSGTKASADGRCGPQIQECWEFEHPRSDVVLDARGEWRGVVIGPVFRFVSVVGAALAKA